MTKDERALTELFLQMLSTHNQLTSEQREHRFLQTTKIAQWLSEKLQRDVSAKTVVKLFEDLGYHSEFVVGGFHHWVKGQ